MLCGTCQQPENDTQLLRQQPCQRLPSGQLQKTAVLLKELQEAVQREQERWEAHHRQRQLQRQAAVQRSCSVGERQVSGWGGMGCRGQGVGQQQRQAVQRSCSVGERQVSGWGGMGCRGQGVGFGV